MTKVEAKARIEKLRREINHHRYLYHVLDRQEISDEVLDSLKHELYELEAEFPDLITPDSPTQRVAGKALDKFKKVRHGVRMVSLNDAFSREELGQWEARLRKFLPGETFEYFAEAKGDGFAVSLIYERGIFAVGSTRGDGLIGEDVTLNLKTVESIPLRIHPEPSAFARKEPVIGNIFEKFPRLRQILLRLPSTIEVRGEVYMTKAAFDTVNREQKKKGLALFSNPRNIAAGSVRQLDPKVAALRKLAFFAWDLVSDLGQETHEEEHAIMKILGFPTIPLARQCKTIDEVENFWREVGEKREVLPYLIDGVVVQVNQMRLFEKLGIVGKAPRGAIAFKFRAKEATTVVRDIIVQVGRTGILTPVAVLKPVQIGGVRVSRATLHNLDEIRRLDVRIGDTVIVERAGDVIPAVTAVLKRIRPKHTREFHMPKKCPICGSPVIHRQGEVAYRCSNKNCQALQKEGLYHFVSKGALDIQGLGPKIIDELMAAGLIRDAADLFLLKKEDVAGLERFGEKSTSNLITAVQDKRRVPLHRFLFGVGIPQVGEKTAEDLSEHFGSFERLRHASQDELLKVRDIGNVVAQSIRQWFENERHKKLLEKFTKVGLVVLSPRRRRGRQLLQGKSFVITGTLEVMSRGEAKDKIRSRGGEVSESVSRRTDYVVVGRDPGSKYDKARKLGVKMISEKEFLALVK